MYRYRYRYRYRNKYRYRNRLGKGIFTGMGMGRGIVIGTSLGIFIGRYGICTGIFTYSICICMYFCICTVEVCV